MGCRQQLQTSYIAVTVETASEQRKVHLQEKLELRGVYLYTYIFIALVYFIDNLQQNYNIISATATLAAVMNGTANCTFTKTELTWLSGTRGVAGTVCLTLTLLVLILFACIKPAKNFRLRILLFLTVSTFFYLLFITMQATMFWEDVISDYTILCEVIAFFILYFGWQELLLVSSITVYLYFYFVRFNDIFGARRQGEAVPKMARVGEVVLFLILLLVPIIPAGLGFIQDGYGETRGWCWIKSLNSDCMPFLEGILRQVFLWYLWCVLCGIVTLGFLFKIVYTMRSNAKQHSGNADRLAKEFKKREREGMLLLIYLGVFHAVNIVELVGDAILSYTVSDSLFPLWVIFAMLSPVSVAAIPVAFLVVVWCFYHEEIHSPCCRCNCKDFSHRDEVQPILEKTRLYTPRQDSDASPWHTSQSSLQNGSLLETPI